MRNLAICVFVTVASMAATAYAQSTPSYTPGKPSGRVWTNDDMDQLRARGLISTFKPGTEATAPTRTAPPSEMFIPRAPRPAREMDPDWYAEQAARLEVELESRQSALEQYIRAVQDAKSREHMTSGLALDKGDFGITPEAGAEILQSRVNEIANQLDDLADLARENGIAPGVLRG